MNTPAWLSGLRGQRSAAGVPRGAAVSYAPKLGTLRVAAIGDIHGRADLLEALHARLDVEAQRGRGQPPIEIYLGDYIDRGPQSREVVEALIARRHARQVVCLMGNHERMLLRAIETPDAVEAWMHLGGETTLRSYGLLAAAYGSHGPGTSDAICRALREGLPAEHGAFLNSLTLSFAIGGLFFAHAGIRPGVPLTAQKEDDLLWIRDAFHSSQADHGAIIVHGHTPVRAPEFRKNRINLDTGAVYTGILSCLLIADDELRFI